MNLSHVIDALVEEGGLDRAALIQIICEGMLGAYQKKYPELTLTANFNKKTDNVDIFVQKKVVASVEDENREVSLRKARTFDPQAALETDIIMPFEAGIGRIEILKAKQIIAQKIRAIEASKIYNEFKPKEGTIVHGVIHKCERNGAIVKIQGVYGFLPKSLMIADARCVVGYTVRALLKEVFLEPKNENQLILDQVSPKFLRELFDIEIPEVFERIVEVKKIVREPGYKSKVIVASHDKNIDPVGTCVGVGGARIKPILRELGAEKIDIIAETPSLVDLVKEALRPAVVDNVVIKDGVAQVSLADDQRSLAIGKMGKNISLASELVGLPIDLVKNELSGQGLADIFSKPAEKKETNGPENKKLGLHDDQDNDQES